MTRSRLFPLAQASLVLALFAFLAWRLDLAALRGALSDAHVGALAVVVALNIPVIALFAARMHLVLLRLGHPLPADVVTSVALVGNVAGSLTPASSGEMLRAASLRSHSDISLDDAIALVFFERGVSLYVLALGTLAAFSAETLPAAVAIVIVAASFTALALPYVFAPLLDRLPTGRDGSLLGRMLRRLRSVGGRLRRLLRSPGLLLPWLALTMAVFVLFTLQFWLLARSLEDVVSPNEMWVAFGASQLAAIVSLVPLGLVTSDASLAGILNRFGMTLEGGAAVAILVRAAITLPMIMAAAAAWLYLSRATPATSFPAPTAAEAPDQPA